MRFISYLLATSFLLASGVAASAQQSFKIPLVVRNSGAGTDKGELNLQFGLDPQATYGIDAGLGEEEYPPFPPTAIFEARFVNIAGHPVGTPAGLGEGVRVDLRPYSGTAQKDTFKIKFQSGDGGYPITISWPADLAAHSHSMTIKSGSGTVDMLKNTSITITDPDVTAATIVRDGDAAAGVEEDAAATGQLFHLSGSSPNPAHATDDIHIDYSIARPAHVTLALYDALGQLVRTVLDEHQSNPCHSIRVKLGGLAPGVYFYRLSAGVSTASGTLLIVD
ncbi:MAG: cadherin protein [Chlorobi bacterium]|nr:cadherin protein [Chlorobiota bacterium]